jgi:hypothetical protein
VFNDYFILFYNKFLAKSAFFAYNKINLLLSCSTALNLRKFYSFAKFSFKIRYKTVKTLRGSAKKELCTAKLNLQSYRTNHWNIVIRYFNSNRLGATSYGSRQAGWSKAYLG